MRKFIRNAERAHSRGMQTRAGVQRGFAELHIEKRIKTIYNNTNIGKIVQLGEGCALEEKMGQAQEDGWCADILRQGYS